MNVYHGTSLTNSLEIASDRAILSPAAQYTQFLGKVDKELYHRRYGNMSIEEVLSQKEREEYGREALRFRTISLTEEIKIARGYAKERGIVLELELNEEEIKQYQPSSVIYIPEKISLDHLRKIHFSFISRQNRNIIKKAFAEYEPVFENI